MIIEVFDTNKNSITLPYPLSLNILKEENVPADSLTAIFALDGKLPELSQIKVTDGGEVIFSGIIDEQLTFIKDGAALFRIICRSMAAPLLDSEAYPRSYVLPSIDIIYEKCLKPYGIKGVIGGEGSFGTTYTVDKGMSNWQVLEDFCSRFLRVNPKITADGYLDLSNSVNDNLISLSNKDGIIYSAISQSLKRHSQISHVFARLSVNGDYSYEMRNENAIDRGIYNVRYLNCAEEPNEYLSIADKMIEKSLKNRLTYIVSCPGRMLDVLNSNASIDDDIIGKHDGLIVYSVEFTLDGSGERTELKLREKV